MKTKEEIERRIQFLENGIIYAEANLNPVSRKYVKLENETKMNVLKWVLENEKDDEDCPKEHWLFGGEE